MSELKISSDAITKRFFEPPLGVMIRSEPLSKGLEEHRRFINIHALTSLSVTPKVAAAYEDTLPKRLLSLRLIDRIGSMSGIGLVKHITDSETYASHESEKEYEIVLGYGEHRFEKIVAARVDCVVKPGAVASIFGDLLSFLLAAMAYHHLAQTPKDVKIGLLRAHDLTFKEDIDLSEVLSVSYYRKILGLGVEDVVEINRRNRRSVVISSFGINAEFDGLMKVLEGGGSHVTTQGCGVQKEQKWPTTIKGKLLVGRVSSRPALFFNAERS